MSFISPLTTAAIQLALIAAFDGGRFFGEPYPHWIVANLFPEAVVEALLALPFAAPGLRVSGTREINNATRRYFDEAHRRQYPVMDAVAQAFQQSDTVAAIERTCGSSLTQTSLRIEYTQDIDGFWLEPHTDIGPKKLSLLAYLSHQQDESLGTDVYASPTAHYKTIPFHANTALVFVPSDRTWHGFEKKPIAGVRTSVIVNYVSGEWRAKEQLSFPGTPVS